MKAAITDGNGHVQLENISIPQPGPYECLCQIEACATCTGTDKKLVNGQMPWANRYPAILGHESFGIVVQCGSKVRNIQPGERYLRPFAAYPDTLLDGHSSWMGGFAEYGLITDTTAMIEDDPTAIPNPYCRFQQIVPISLPITSADATMLVTLKEIASFIRDLGIKADSKVVILGAGTVSMAMGFFAKLAGAYPVITAARRDQPLEDCQKTGADFTINIREGSFAEKVMGLTDRSGADFILDAAGDPELIMEAARSLANSGAICSYAGRVGAQPLVIEQIKGPAKWKYVQGGPDETSAHQYLLDLVRIQAIPMANFYSHTLPFEQFDEGFQLLVAKKASKIVFTMGTA